jgi:hypothetical protein
MKGERSLCHFSITLKKGKQGFLKERDIKTYSTALLSTPFALERRVLLWCRSGTFYECHRDVSKSHIVSPCCRKCRQVPKLVISGMAVRSLLILALASLTVFLTYKSQIAFAFPFILLIVFLIFYCFGLVPDYVFFYFAGNPNRKVQRRGQLLAVVSLANVVGSLMGGAIIGTFGYLAWFCNLSWDCSACYPHFSYKHGNQDLLSSQNSASATNAFTKR